MLFTMVKKEGTGGGALGYDRIQVLAIRPWALAYPGPEYGKWCKLKISCLYICIADGEFQEIPCGDFEPSMDEYELEEK
jgi:hypothetical protein